MIRRCFVSLAMISTLLLTASPATAAPEPVTGSAGTSAAKAKRKSSVAIIGVGQRQLVSQRVLKVKVRSARRGRIRVSGASTTFDRRGRFYRLTRVARPRFKRAGQLRIVKLRLTDAGRTAVTRCEDRDIQVTAGRVRSRILSLVRQSNACAPRPIDLSRADRCDFIVEQSASLCMAPFPSNFYTRGADTATGRQINFRSDAMPTNSGGTAINPAPYNENDGFSQGQTISLRVPGLDNANALAMTNPVGLADPERYLDANAPVVVINSATLKRHPIWAEIDSNASSPGTTNLMIHPMVNFEAGTRYVVALRGLKDQFGTAIQSPMGFRYYRDTLPSRAIRINQRRSYFEDVFRRLRNAAVPRASLYLAWDFTTATDENNSKRTLSMRDQAFAELGDTDLADRSIPAASSAPAFTVDSTDVDPNPQVSRRIKGHFDVPCYLTNPGNPDPCGPGGTLNLDGDGVPVKTGTWSANFECLVPHNATDGPDVAPRRAMVYGHGLLGSIGGEIDADPQRELADEFGFVICGTDEIGMAASDIGTVAVALTNLSTFPKIADRLQQGLLNGLFLTRLMIHPDGLTSDPAFRSDMGDMNSSPVIATNAGRAYYRGNSQGGIMGGALTALSPDFDRAALGVSGMNYSVLLNRSSAWATYRTIFNPSYSDETIRPLALSLVQMLWDRGEPNGYAHRMTTDPLPNTPPHKVLMDIAFGDHLVSNWQANVMARTVGARAVNPFVFSGRWPGVDGQWGIESITSYPYDGSAIAYWDSGPFRSDPGNPGGTLGTPAPPIQNVAPIAGNDPHEDPRRAETNQQMVSEFLQPQGRVSNPCSPGACYSAGFVGP